jgi:hypothetical protein
LSDAAAAVLKKKSQQQHWHLDLTANQGRSEEENPKKRGLDAGKRQTGLAATTWAVILAVTGADARGMPAAASSRPPGPLIVIVGEWAQRPHGESREPR